MATPVARKTRKPTAVQASQPPPDPAAALTAAAGAGPDTPPPMPSELIGTTTATTGQDAIAPLPPMLDEVTAMVVHPDALSAGWVYNRAITHLWSYDARVGLGGRHRLEAPLPVSAFAHSHMTELATIATHRNLPVDYHEDAAGQIDQLLV